MNKKKLLLISCKAWAFEYLKMSVIGAKIKDVTIILEKKDAKIDTFIKDNKLKYKVFILGGLKTTWIKKNIDYKNTLTICAASAWIINSEIIKLFKKNIFNIHQSALPSFRGSVNSFVRLYNIRALQTTLHLVQKTIDTGKVVFYKDFYVDRKLVKPIEINNYIQLENRKMLKEFLIDYFILNKKLNYSEQNNFFSSYQPRLKSEINGWIDWSLNVNELDRFIGAFDDPYPGAKAMIHGKKVSLFDVDPSCVESSKHPFENGMVIRKFMKKLVVAVNGGSLYISKVISGKKNIIEKIQPGDIFYSPKNKIDLSKRRNLFLEKKNIYTKNNKIKKFI
tara:strand:- start:53 stop:1060 length:1008 start_codon:yes stop_codon:yes gene_type:complete